MSQENGLMERFCQDRHNHGLHLSDLTITPGGFLSYPVPQRLNHHQICLITQGQGHCTIDTQTMVWHDRSLLLMARGQLVHSRPLSETRGYLISFCEQDMFDPNQQQPAGIPFHLFDPQRPSGALQLDLAGYQSLTSIVQMLQAELQLESRTRNQILYCLFCLLLLKIEQFWLVRHQSLTANSNDCGLFLRFKQALESDFTATRCVNDYAARLCVTVKKLNQITRRYYGKTAKETINERAALEMIRLLTHSGLTIKEIAWQTGFDDPANMSRFFRRHTGQAPGLFKQTWREKTDGF